MILYGDRNPAPNPRRVRIFIAEKGIDLPETRVKITRREHKSPEHKARNSLGQLPTLELDDGTFISESVSICRYLEEIHPDKPMFGRNPVEAATVDMWIRRVEFQLMNPLSQFWRHAHPLTAALRAEAPDFSTFGEWSKDGYYGSLRWLDRELDGRDFVAGDFYSMADIIALTTIDFAAFTGVAMKPETERLNAWHARVTARPSASA